MFSLVSLAFIHVLTAGTDEKLLIAAGPTPWHPDIAADHTPGYPPGNYRAVKFCIYPDTLDASTGALRVIPGSHREPLQSELRRLLSNQKKLEMTALGVSQDSVPCYIFESQPGDVIVFSAPLFHASFGGEAGRRQGVMVYYEDPQDDPIVTTAIQKQMAGNHNVFRDKGVPMYPRYWRDLEKTSSLHATWMKRMDHFDCLETKDLQMGVANSRL
eukprot:SAG31_NODE_3326_length_4408_cov_3.213739_2_plen_215_part_00